MKYDPLPWMWVAFVPQKKETKLLKENSIEYRIERRTLFVRSKDWEASRKLLLRHTNNRMSYYDYGGKNASIEITKSEGGEWLPYEVPESICAIKFPGKER